MVKAVEFQQKDVPFDVVDDVAIFMRNDPIIYRKSLFPAIMNMKDRFDSGKKCVAEECLGEIVDSAIPEYCNKFKLGSPKNVFKKGDRDSIVNKLYAEEMTQIKNGAY
jgi:hypothetical protein